MRDKDLFYNALKNMMDKHTGNDPNKKGLTLAHVAHPDAVRHDLLNQPIKWGTAITRGTKRVVE